MLVCSEPSFKSYREPDVWKAGPEQQAQHLCVPSQQAAHTPTSEQE